MQASLKSLQRYERRYLNTAKYQNHICKVVSVGLPRLENNKTLKSYALCMTEISQRLAWGAYVPTYYWLIKIRC